MAAGFCIQNFDELVDIRFEWFVYDIDSADYIEYADNKSSDS